MKTHSKPLFSKLHILKLRAEEARKFINVQYSLQKMHTTDATKELSSPMSTTSNQLAY